MAYIGQGIKEGTFSVLDTSGNTYNGSNVTFSLGTQVGSPAQLLVSHDGVIQKPGTDYSLATGGTQITFSTAPASGASIFIVEISGAVGGPLDSDLNGTELILDADGDTSLHASTDDQIDVKIAGADDFKFTANTFTANSGSSIIVPDGGLTFGSTAISSTAAELNILDGVTATAAELNLIDGGTSRGTTAIADGDGVLINDAGTMRQTTVETLKTYIGGPGLVYITGNTVSSAVANISLTSAFSTTYNVYKVIGQISVATNGADVHLNFIKNSDGSLATDNAHYVSGGATAQGNGAQSTENQFGGWGTTYARFLDGMINSDTTIANFEITVFNPMVTDTNKSAFIKAGYYRSNDRYITASTAFTLNDGGSNAFNGIRITPSSGNIDKGSVRVYGVVNS